MILALDTNVVVDLVRQKEPVRTNFRQTVESGASIQISALVLQELLAGVEVSGQPERENSKLVRVLAGMEIVPFERSDALVGGRVKAAMQIRGRKAPADDLIIGVHALARGAALVTANTRHFEHIPGLTLLSWRQPPEELQD